MVIVSCTCKMYSVPHRTIYATFSFISSVSNCFGSTSEYIGEGCTYETCSCPVLFFFLFTQQQVMSTTSRAPVKKDTRETAMGMPTAAPVLRIVRPVSMPEDNKQLKLLQVLKVLNSLVPRPLFNSQEENSYRLLK